MVHSPVVSGKLPMGSLSHFTCSHFCLQHSEPESPSQLPWQEERPNQDRYWGSSLTQQYSICLTRSVSALFLLSTHSS